MRGQVATFPIDHIVPRSAGGETTPDNLALACPHCNGRKWVRTQANDPLTGELVELFSPRTENWDDHFRWSETEPVILEGKTPRGRATIALLELNHRKLVETRELLLELGLFFADASD